MLETLKVFLHWLLPNYFKKENLVSPRPAAQEPPPAPAAEILIDIDDDTPPLLKASLKNNDDREAEAEPASITPPKNCLRPIALKPLSPPGPIAIPGMFEPRDDFKLSENPAFSPVARGPAKMGL